MGGSRSRIAVPDLVGLNADDACDVVRGAGLVPYGPDYETPPDTGVVIAQCPDAADEERPGAAVFLWTTGGRVAADALHRHPVESASPV